MKVIALLVLVATCAGSAAEVERAKGARYDADLAVVLAGAIDAVRQHYGTLEVQPPNALRTAWHQVDKAVMSADRDAKGRAQADGKFFVRFDVTISTTRPSSIEVVGRAAFWRTGMAVPTELHGADEPAWLQPRIDRLRVQIHEQLAQYAH